ncbi:thermonuclease family protein [Candidatus Parcubacteria bacterium]|nr:thermonuclease family protein [Candidatus Parcubacteria bacterium]
MDHATTSTDDVTKITKAPVTSQPSKTIEISEIADVAQPKQSSTTTTPLEQKEEYYLVTNVVDGDTFDVSINGVTERIRLIGMDTPELKDPRKPVQCFAAEASKKATDLLLNKKVKLITDPTQDDIDKYNRLLRYAYREDGLFFNKWMIENGYAFEYTYVIPYQYQQEFKDAELYARNNLLGLWSPDTCNGSTEIKTTPTAENPAVLPPGEHKWYTSSYYSAEYYYCDTDNQWEGLSKTYLKEFNSAEELLSAYPSRTLHEPCR